MTMLYQQLVSVFPGRANYGSLKIRKSSGVDLICVVVIKNKNIMIAATGNCRELSGLV